MTPATQPRLARLNPFLFPSDTSFRFALLIFAVVGASLLIDLMIFNHLPWTWNYAQRMERDCTAHAQHLHPGKMIKHQAARAAAASACRAPLDHRQAAWILGGVVILLSTAFVLYWRYPKRKIKQDRLVPLTAEDAPEVATLLEEMVRTANLRHVPQFLWNPLETTVNALAFGRWRRYYVALSGGVVSQAYADREAFRALVLHELAHLKNDDVDKTYFSVALWQAFVAVGLAPCALVLVVGFSSFASLWSLVWRVAALAALVFLARNAVLRAREFYADLRASLWHGGYEALDRALGGLRRLTVWKMWFQVHPDPARRRLALRDTQPMFRMGFWLALGVGMAATISFSNFEFLISLFVPSAYAFFRSLCAAILLGSMVAIVMGLGIWRGTVAAFVSNTPRPRIAVLGSGLVLGCFVGHKISLASYAYARSDAMAKGVSLVMFDTAWILFLAIGVFVILLWLRDSAALWIKRQENGEGLKLASFIGVAVGVALLSAWLGLVFYSYAFAFAAPGMFDAQQWQTELGFRLPQGIVFFLLLGSGALFGVAQHPIAVALTFALVLFPMMAWLGRDRERAPYFGWAFLDDVGEISVDSESPERERILFAGIGGGIVFAVILSTHWLSSPGTLVLAAALIQSAVASVAVFNRDRDWLHGMFAALLTACLGSVALLMFYAELGATSLWSLVRLVFVGGLLLTIPAALLAALPWTKQNGRHSGRHRRTTGLDVEMDKATV